MRHGRRCFGVSILSIGKIGTSFFFFFTGMILIIVYSFASTLTGLPVLLHEEDIHTEYPSDVDDENVTESGFMPALPGESTRLSSALALFAVSRILGKVLEDLYPTGSSYDVPISKINSLSDQLDEWHLSLPSHLRLGFAQDKPSTDMTTSRSLLLVSGPYVCPLVCTRLINIRLAIVAYILLYPIIDPSSCCLLWWHERKLFIASRAVGFQQTHCADSTVAR